MSARPQSTRRPYPAAKVYRLLEPGPVIMVTTRSRAGVANVMTMGFHMVIQHDSPPLLALCLGPWDHSFAALRETGECVIAIPGCDLAETMVDIGNCSGADTDKFATFPITAHEASKVSAPLIAECLANIECRVSDAAMVERYGVWIVEPVCAWVDPSRAEQRILHHRGDGTFSIEGDRIDLRERMTLWKQFQD